MVRTAQRPRAEDLARLDLLSKSYRSRGGASLRRELLKDPRLPRLVSDCCLNVRSGAVRIKKRGVVARNAKTIVKLSNKSTPPGEKRKLIQRGGFLQYLLPAAISIIAGLIK